MKENKLVLGTAQLGLDYGIANTVGKPTKKQAIEIIKYAVENGINYFDTAYSYGNSEIIICKFLNTYKSYKNKINIITKMVPLNKEKSDENEINNRFFESLNRLGQKSIYCYMMHDYNDIKNNCDLINDIFLKLKEEGYIKKVGVSVYDKNQIDYLLKNFNFDLIQLPVSVFDQRLLENNVLSELKKRKKDIYARSVFLQGLVFFNENNLLLKFTSVKKHFKKLNGVSLKNKLSKEEIALLFVNSIKEIDKIIIGVETIEQLKKNIETLNKLKCFYKLKSIIGFKNLSIKNINIIDPRRWA